VLPLRNQKNPSLILPPSTIGSGRRWVTIATMSTRTLPSGDTRRAGRALKTWKVVAFRDLPRRRQV